MLGWILRYGRLTLCGLFFVWPVVGFGQGVVSGEGAGSTGGVELRRMDMRYYGNKTGVVLPEEYKRLLTKMGRGGVIYTEEAAENRGIWRGKPTRNDWMAYLLRVQRGSLGKYQGFKEEAGGVYGMRNDYLRQGVNRPNNYWVETKELVGGHRTDKDKKSKDGEVRLGDGKRRVGVAKGGIERGGLLGDVDAVKKVEFKILASVRFGEVYVWEDFSRVGVVEGKGKGKGKVKKAVVLKVKTAVMGEVLRGANKGDLGGGLKGHGAGKTVGRGLKSELLKKSKK